MKRSLTKAAHFVKRLILNGGGAQYANILTKKIKCI
jgi:hypothetical protein